MKHPARWLIALALLACALAWWWNAPPPEPVFRGQPLSQWMLDSVDQDDTDIVAPYEEMRALGPPVVAWLAYTAEHGRSHHGKPGVMQEFLARIGWRSAVPQSPIDYDERIAAMSTLEKLGTMAKPAIPTLVRILNSSSYNHVETAASTLNLMGSDAWPVVKDQLTHGSNLARCELLNTLWLRFGPERGDPPERDIISISLLGQALRDKEPNIRRNAASALPKMVRQVKVPGPLMDQVALALWALPDESNKEVREAKQGILSYYRDTKADVVPRLTALLTDPDEAKRNFALAILAKIEPDSNKTEAP